MWDKVEIYFGLRKPPIRVGILHSFTGSLAMSEKSVADATLMAIDEINDNGGILDRKIEAVIVDGRSDWRHFMKMAEQLIVKEKVSVVFGCWTSACRKSIKPIFEQHNHLLIYPVQYEGLEESPNIIYTGAAPNQQIIPTIKWAFDNLGKRFFLVGSDYVFPRTANAIIKDQLSALGGEVVGEEYILLGSSNVENVINKIVKARPKVIINTINGDSNIAFFREIRSNGITPDECPTISFSIGEDELRNLDPAQAAGDYAAWNYFQNIPSKINQDFVNRYQEKYGQDRVTDDPIEAGYIGVYLWAQAVTDARTDNIDKVRQAFKKQSLIAPEGRVHVDPDNQHIWKIVRVGKVRKDGQFDIVWSSIKPIQPIPYPGYRSKEKWDQFLNELYKGWGNKWSNEV